MFFFQAEDGIRDLVRSRGLGDVYKRQGLRNADLVGALLQLEAVVAKDEIAGDIQGASQVFQVIEWKVTTTDQNICGAL